MGPPGPRWMMSQMAPIQNLTRVPNAYRDDMPAGRANFCPAGCSTFLLILLQSVKREYPFVLQQDRANRCTRIAGSNIQAIVFLREPLTPLLPHRSIAITGREPRNRARRKRGPS